MNTGRDQGFLCDMLDRIEPGLLPSDVFHAVARLVVTPTFVVVPLLVRGGRLLVLLRERDAGDPHYASLLHPAGTVIRSTDEDLPSAYRRLLRAELPDVTVKRGPVFVEVVLDRIARGRELSLIHWIELDDSTPEGDLFDVDALPGNVVPTDYRRIERAAAHFRAHPGS